MKNSEKIKIEMQRHNMKNGLTWNEIGEFLNEFRKAVEYESTLPSDVQEALNSGDGTYKP